MPILQRLAGLSGMAALVLAGSLTAAVPAQAAPAAVTPCPAWNGAQPPVAGVLSGVAETTGCNAWAVGSSNGQTLILHWDGHSWTRQSSPSPGTAMDFLNGVAATSPTNAWAVGTYINGSGSQALILHWNGQSWRQEQQLPALGAASSALEGIKAVSASSIWAVGSDSTNGTVGRTVILHWNGHKWSRQASPGTANDYLFGVTATSGKNAWAVGKQQGAAGSTGLILHWNGKSWARQKNHAAGMLTAAAATGTASAWAVGQGGLILHWNGRTWAPQRSPVAGAYWTGAVALSKSSATIVGFTSGQFGKSVAAHWNGKAWAAQPEPQVGTADSLEAVAQAPANGQWAVGYDTSGSLAVHCC